MFPHFIQNVMCRFELDRAEIDFHSERIHITGQIVPMPGKEPFEPSEGAKISFGQVTFDMLLTYATLSALESEFAGKLGQIISVQDKQILPKKKKG